MLDTPILSQRDPLWQSKKLGFSTATIGQSGCAVTVLAMLINSIYPLDEQVTPLMVNNALMDNDAFTGPAHNLIAWTLVSRAYYRLYYYNRIDASTRPLKQYETAEIKRRLMYELPIIAYVDAKKQEPGLQQHFVLIVNQDPNTHDYVIADPWYGDIVPLCSRYGPRPEIALCGLILYDVNG
jgi:hypothetical protein